MSLSDKLLLCFSSLIRPRRKEAAMFSILHRPFSLPSQINTRACKSERDGLRASLSRNTRDVPDNVQSVSVAHTLSEAREC